MDRCVCCGEPVPEGRMVCPICEKNVLEDSETIKVHFPKAETKESSGTFIRPAALQRNS